MTIAYRALASAACLAAWAAILSPDPAAAQASVGGAPGPAAAQPNLVAPPGQMAALTGIIDEVKTGVVVHDVGFLGHHIEHGEDINLEMLFTSPDFLAIIGSPRPHIGADINDEGNTSDGYLGLTWGITLLHDLLGPGDGIFANGSLGGAYQDGYTLSAPDGRKRLGSPVLFRESAELGYQATPRLSVSLYLEHISNANLAPRNAGITSAGARIGVKF